MNTKDILNRVDEAACLEFLSRMIQHKSYCQTEGEAVLAKHMVEQMRNLGIEATLQPFEDGKRFNAIGRMRGQGGGKSLLFNGHLDTNPVAEGWTVDPWEGKIDENFIYGIGVSNMKAGDAAYFCAVKTLLDAGVKLKGDVVLTYVVGELQGGVGTVAAIEGGAKADYFINSEPSDLYAITMHAAALGFIIEITGITRHLSKREEAVDAIEAACALVPRLNRMTFSGAKSPEHLGVNRCHVGVMRGALGQQFEEWRPPQVADFVRLKGSARYAPGQTQESVIEDMRKFLADFEKEWPGLQCKLIPEITKDRLVMPPFEVAKNSRIVKSLNQAYFTVRGEEQPTGAISPTRFYGTDAAHFYSRLGMEGVVCGPGGRYNTMPDERVDRVDYLDMIRVYMAVIMDICEVVD